MDQALAELKPRQVGGDDPIRTQMVTLANSGKRVVVPRPPTSPIPAGRISRSKVTAPTLAPVASRSRRVRTGFLIALGATLFAGGIVVSRLALDRRGVEPAPIQDPRTAVPTATAPDTTSRRVLALGDTSSVKGAPPKSPDRLLPPAAAPSAERKPRVSLATEPAKKAPDTTVAAVPLSVVAPPRAPPPATNGWVRLGSRAENAVVYINGTPQLPKSPSLRWWKVPLGSVRLSVAAEGCKSWEGTVQIHPGDSLPIGNRYPRCGVDQDSTARDSTGGQE